MSKGLKTRKHVTNRIITKEDVENVLSAIETAYKNDEIDADLYLHYRAIVIFSAFTGQRSQATTARLTVGQFRKVVDKKKPVLDILPEQDKIRMQHYCPLHPQVVSVIASLLDGRRDEESAFKQLLLDRWLRKQKIALVHCDTHLLPGDLRKFCEQQGDTLQWGQSNKNYILTHGVSGVDWRFYKHPLPEHVYDVYMQYWKEVELSC
jgi:integrase